MHDCFVININFKYFFKHSTISQIFRCIDQRLKSIMLSVWALKNLEQYNIILPDSDVGIPWVGNVSRKDWCACMKLHKDWIAGALNMYWLIQAYHLETWSLSCPRSRLISCSQVIKNRRNSLVHWLAYYELVCEWSLV